MVDHSRRGRQRFPSQGRLGVAKSPLTRKALLGERNDLSFAMPFLLACHPSRTVSTFPMSLAQPLHHGECKLCDLKEATLSEIARWKNAFVRLQGALVRPGRGTKKIARELKMHLPNLQLVLPDGQLLAKVCRTNPGASVAQLSQSTQHPQPP